MMTLEDQTLNLYDRNAESYKTRTDHINLEDHYDRVIRFLGGRKGKVLDLGCGPGRDSKFFIDSGFSVTSVDGSRAMIDLVSKVNENSRLLKFENLDYCCEFDLVWSSASLLHIEKEKIRSVLELIRDSLSLGGVFYLSLKEGKKNFIDDQGRYFSTYEMDELEAILESVDGFKIAKIWRQESLVTHTEEQQVWLGAVVVRG
ncbi:class I SAM-dependent DNA methyltransferase [Pseudobacteriovorax antillogorgiicola]|uniref:Methyltransferase domain-containing protein n=1 Tax=Pseudobacteriovorax antillogorgiicola TaxID=1513793 RepID=A0A1Y6BMK6_9BACT|nr:class I SAM-dependent methyltransferase [Pseudobacteriovorax antillogorgiicola]TCS53956.1 methyltransferase family protein [Pseudobacteriovorax antillogorgiicola]SMF20056.1 Methyltransferase domain-containing protein [Pseudobacteriovorax antillogorgiicola]